MITSYLFWCATGSNSQGVGGGSLCALSVPLVVFCPTTMPPPPSLLLLLLLPPCRSVRSPGGACSVKIVGTAVCRLPIFMERRNGAFSAGKSGARVTQPLKSEMCGKRTSNCVQYCKLQPTALCAALTRVSLFVLV